MSMKLSAADLRTIADQIDKLSEIDGVSIGEVFIADHKVFLRKERPREYSVIGITDKNHGVGGAMRGGTQQL